MTISIAQIVAVSAPMSVPAGGPVTIDVHVKNNSTSTRFLSITGVFDSTAISFQFEWLEVLPYQIVVFRGSFTMPSQDVRATLWSWDWIANEWRHNETRYCDIKLAELESAISEFQILDYIKV